MLHSRIKNTNLLIFRKTNNNNQNPVLKSFSFSQASSISCIWRGRGPRSASAMIKAPIFTQCWDWTKRLWLISKVHTIASWLLIREAFMIALWNLKFCCHQVSGKSILRWRCKCNSNLYVLWYPKTVKYCLHIMLFDPHSSNLRETR